MITYSGASVFPENSGAPSIFDIAVGIGRMPRFAGQTRIYYTVLAHTLVVSRIVSPEASIYALLHDAPEAIVADVPTPWKSEQAKEYENILIERICRELGVTWPAPQSLWDEVLAADAAALAAEAHVLGHVAAESVWPSSQWSAIVWLARDETLKQVNRGCVWGLDPDTAHAEYRREINLATASMRPDTILKPISN